jgi:beta-glucanase (GH16 family)
MTIDYFTKQVKFNKTNGGVELMISAASKPDVNPDAPRLSTTRLMLYGRVTAVLRAPAVPGVVTTFITMGPHLPDEGIDMTNTDPQGGDEIDWEILGNDPENAQSNIFYRGFREFSVRGGYHPLPKKSITVPHKYTIDWRRDQILFSIDDVVQRRYLKNSTQANSKEAPGRRFFPDR